MKKLALPIFALLLTGTVMAGQTVVIQLSDADVSELPTPGKWVIATEDAQNVFTWEATDPATLLVIADSPTSKHHIVWQSKGHSPIIIQLDASNENYTVLPTPHIFPNPSAGQLKLSTPLNAKVVLRDMQGKIVYEATIEKDSIGAAELPSGVYVAMIGIDEMQYTERLVIE